MIIIYINYSSNSINISLIIVMLVRNVKYMKTTNLILRDFYPLIYFTLFDSCLNGSIYHIYIEVNKWR